MRRARGAFSTSTFLTTTWSMTPRRFLTRFRILGALSLGEKSVSDLEEICAVSQSAISHQLRLLRDRGLVTARRDGRRVIYSLADEHVTTLISVGLLHAAEPVRASEE